MNIVVLNDTADVMAIRQVLMLPVVCTCSE